ncbi:MAG: cyclodeaminase/cyclohydrolase family protein [Phycisphaerales bacterium JB037]
MDPMHQTPLAHLLDAIAAKTPAPGGGAVASITGTLAAALAQMVLSYSIGRKSLAEHDAELRQAASRLERARHLLLQLAEEDAAAYEQFNALQQAVKTNPELARKLPAAAARAIAVPRAVLATAADLSRLLLELPARTNKHLASDLAIAAILCDATARAAAWNVRINLPTLPDAADRDAVTRECAALLAEIADRVHDIERACGASA